MTWIDLVILLIVVLGAVHGVQRGFIRGTFDVVAIVMSLLIAALTYPHAARLISALLELPGVLVNVIGFILVALVAQGLFSIVIGATVAPLARQVRSVPPLRWIDGGFGVVPGLVKGIAFAAIIVLLTTLFPPAARFDDAVAASPVAQRLLTSVTDVTYWAREATGINLADFTVVVTRESEAAYQLPYTVTEGLEASPRDEAEMLALVNEERIQRGLPPLAADEDLRAVARAHSEEMLRLGYFAHQSPVTGGPGDRLAAAGVRFAVAGENLAYAPTVAIAHRGLMRSDGHRANILSPEFTRVGIGVITTPQGAKMFTQVFAAP